MMMNYNCLPVIPLPFDTYILDMKQGDVNGDKIIDNVYLVGKKPFGSDSPFRDNIEIIIQDCRTNKLTRIPLKFNAGYLPKLFLGDFNGDKVDDIFVEIRSGGSGGFGFFYIYSFLCNRVRKLFDFEEFNASNDYRVTYRDFYAVDVANLTTTRLFGIDIFLKGPDYLSELYDENGKLKEPVEGFVGGITELYPIDMDKDGVFELEAVQRVTGIANADTLGYVKSYLDWNGTEFEQKLQEVCVFSVNLISPAKS